MDVQEQTTLDYITADVQEYRAAEEALEGIAAAESSIDELFAEELQLVDRIKAKMATKLQELLAERGVEEGSKVYEALQKDIRKRLYDPMKFLVVTGHKDVTGKTLKQKTFQVTLVESKPKLAEKVMPEMEGYAAHKADVQRFIDAGLHSLLSIATSDAAIGYVQASAQSGNPLQSVELAQDGYCKVKLL